MAVSDPIADMLTRVRNAIMVKHESVTVPSSKMALAIARILKEEGFVADYEVLKGTPQRSIKVHLRYVGRKEPIIRGLKRVSKPGMRIYVKHDRIPRVYGSMGVAILSTPAGVMTGQQARLKTVGGEILCYIW